MAHANQLQEATTYFNLHTVGIGYLNRVREVQVRRGQPFMACDIAALHGATDAVEYTRFDCKVAGGEAERLIRLYMDAVKAEKKRSEELTSELQSLMRISYAVFCLKIKTQLNMSAAHRSSSTILMRQQQLKQTTT